MNYVGKTVPENAQQQYKVEQTPLFNFATEDFPVALLRGGKGLPQEGWDRVKSEAEEKIRSVSIEARDSAVSFGEGNTSISISHARNVTMGNISSSKGQQERTDD